MTWTYEKWRKLAFFVSDLRMLEGPLKMDGYQFYESASPVPGAVFLEAFDSFPSDNPYEPRVLGCIQQLDDGRWYVIVGNQDPTFADFEQAARWLWDAHWGCELAPGPRFKLIGVDENGHINHDRVYHNEREMLDALPGLLGENDDYVVEAMHRLTTVGSRFFEFSHGHLVAFPLDR